MSARFPLNGGIAANALTEGKSDATVMPCQLPGARYPCTIVGRDRGNPDTRTQSSAITFATTVAPTTPTSRRQAASSTTQAPTSPSSYGSSDFGIFFNQLVTSGDYADMVRSTKIRGGDLDFTSPFTFTSWLKVDQRSNGFLFAKVDSAFTPDGTPVVLQRALTDIKDRHMSSSLFRLGSDALAVYFGLYINGQDKRVDVIMTRGARSGNVDDWHQVRHFRLSPETQTLLFDGTWRYFAFSFGLVNGQYEGQVYIEGKTLVGDPNFVQCFFWPPMAVRSGLQNTTDADVSVLESGGSLVIGYRLKAAMDELRIYRTDASHRSIVKIGGEEFSGELSVSEQLLYFAFGAGLLIVVICLILCCKDCYDEHKKRKHREEMEKKKEEEDKYRADGGELGASDPPPNALDSSTPLQNNTNNGSPTPVAREAWVGEFEEASPRGNATPKDDPNRKTFEGEEDSKQKEKCGAVTAVAAVGDAAHASALEVMDELQKHATGSERKKADLVNAVATVGDAVQTGQIAYYSTTGGGTGVDETEIANEALDGVAAGAKTAAAAPMTALGLVTSIASAVASRGEYVLRVQIMFDCWQVVTLCFVGFTWPPEFKEWFGRVSGFLAFDFQFVFIDITVDFVMLYYVKIGLTLLSFFLLMGIFVMQARQTREEMLEIHKKTLEDRKKAEEEGKEYSPPLSAKELISFALLFIVQAMYLPCTRDAVVVASCHSSVQCYFDCYQTQSHWNAIYLAVVSFLIITIIMPICLAFIVRRKKGEFTDFVDPDLDNRDEVDEAWINFVKTESSPYRSIYSGFEYRWMYFQALLMLVKAVLCVATLALTQNSTEQLIAVMFVQAVFSLSTFATAPFILSLCDYIMEVSQLFVMIALCISALYRANEALPLGHVLNGSALTTLLVQLVLCVLPASLVS